MAASENDTLFQAIKVGYTPTVCRIVNKHLKLIAEGKEPTININAQDEVGKTFAHHAIKSGVPDIIEKVIVVLRCPVNTKDNSGKEPFYYNWNIERDVLENFVKKAQNIKDNQEKFSALIAQERSTGAYESGIVFTHNFSLIYKGKNERWRSKPVPEETLFIHDLEKLENDIITISPKKEEITLHHKQAIYESFVVTKSVTPQDIEYSLPPASTNYIVANIGCIITKDNWRKKAYDIERIFITETIKVENNSTGYQIADGAGHSEDALYSVLKDEKKLSVILSHLFTTNEIEPKGKKVYAIILDMHSSQNMCKNCEEETFKQIKPNGLIYQAMQDVLKELLRNDNNENHSVSKNEHFKIIVRYSASRNHSFDSNRRSNSERTLEEYGRLHSHDIAIGMDIKKSKSPLILHSDDLLKENLGLWYNKENYYNLFFTMPRHTVFVNGSGSKHYPREYTPPKTISPKLK